LPRAIHFGSPNRAQPFIRELLGLPEQLAESLLFGHTRGAFTGAVADRKGYFELADGGTLFLDESADMPLALQVKLLRVLLEDGEVTPLGATKAVSVRVASSRRRTSICPARLPKAISARTCISGSCISNLALAPLRERRDDIPALAMYFIKRFATELNRKPPALHAGALERLLNLPRIGKHSGTEEHHRAQRSSMPKAIRSSPAHSFLPLAKANRHSHSEMTTPRREAALGMPSAFHLGRGRGNLIAPARARRRVKLFQRGRLLGVIRSTGFIARDHTAR